MPGQPRAKELHVYLHVVAGNLLLVAMRVYGASADSVRKPGHAMALADPIDRGIRALDVVIPRHVPRDADRTHVVGPA